jgi:hypothetical protein
MSEPVWSQEKAAAKIAALLASAEDAAKRGALAERDNFLSKATALQHKYAVDQVMLQMTGEASSEEIIFQDFCTESNTPLIKAKRDLIVGVARLYRGEPLMLEATRLRKGRWVRDKRAAIRVWAHTSDLRFIEQMYTSLILQLQTEMARDEKITHEKVTNAWRVSYAHAWVYRVLTRLHTLNREQEREENQRGTGAEMMLRAKGDVVKQHLADNKLVEGKARRTPVSDKSDAGRRAGDAAGRRADLGQKRAEARTTQAIE